jgi:outer membrane murein-binding lipoprotein Lpp
LFIPIGLLAHTSRRYACAPMRTITITVLAALLLAGCGAAKKPNKADLYVKAVDRDQKAFADAFEEAVNDLATSTSAAGDAQLLRKGATAISVEAGKLAKITPPPKVRRLHGQLIALIRKYATTLRSAAGLVATGRPADFAHAKRMLVDASKATDSQFNQLVGEINTRLG